MTFIVKSDVANRLIRPTEHQQARGGRKETKMIEEHGQSPTNLNDAVAIGAVNIDMAVGLMHALQTVVQTAQAVRQDDPARQVQFFAMADKEFVCAELFVDGVRVKTAEAEDMGDGIGMHVWHDQSVAKFEVANYLPV
jgi:hypothetical protein